MIFLVGCLWGLGGRAQERPPLTPEERRRLMEEMITKAQQRSTAQPGIRPATEPAPAGAVAPPAGPTPSIVQRAPIAGGQVQLAYDNADLYEFVNQIADTLGITPIVIDPEIKGSVTIHSSAPMSREDVFPLFTLILKNNNASLVRQGNIYQIVPISSGLKKGLELIEHLPPPPAPSEGATPAQPPEPGAAQPGAAGQTTPAPQQPVPPQPPPTPPVPPAPPVPPGPPAPQPQPPPPAAAPDQAAATGPARLATHVIRVEFIPVRDLIEPVKLFMTDGGVIMPYERLNMLIVTDYTDSVSKIMEIVRMLDSSYLDADLIELVAVRNNAAQDVVDDLKKIFGGGKDSTTGVNFVSLDRVNSILVMANSKRALQEVKRWIDRLDSSTGRSVQTYIYTVENSTAANIATILSALFGGEGGPAGATGTGTGRGGTGVGATSSAGPFGQSNVGGTAGPFGSSTYSGQTGGTGTFGGGFGSFGQGGYGGYGGGGFGGYGGGGFGGYGGYGGGGFGGGFGGFGGQMLGPRLNQGIGTVSAQILRGGELVGLQGPVRLVVDEINNSLIIQSSAADYQYLLETIKKMDVLPRQAIIDARIFEVDLTDAFSFGVSAALQGKAGENRLTTASTSSENGALSVGTFAFIGNSREILLNIDALRQKTKVRILEAPSVLALDGTMARITVGGEVPYPGASFVAPAGGSTQSVQYRDTGISLIVMPRISASGTVTLDMAQEVSSPGAPTPTGPTFSKTSVSTTLAVKDGETVAIAGLIRDNNNQSRNGIPFLSDIPLVGSLFGRTNRTANRTELLILITPHVIRTPEKFQEMTQDLRDSLRNVRKHADEKDEEAAKDLENARKDRRAREQKEQEKRQEEPKKN